MFGKRSGESLAYSRVQTIIGEGVLISGTIESTGVIRIDGQLQGTIHHSGLLVVGPRGKVEANVRAKGLAVAGEVRGDLEIEEKLEILNGGKVYGDIICGNLVIQEGAVFAGRSHMTDTQGREPLGPKPADSAAAGTGSPEPTPRVS